MDSLHPLPHPLKNIHIKNKVRQILNVFGHLIVPGGDVSSGLPQIKATKRRAG